MKRDVSVILISGILSVTLGCSSSEHPVTPHMTPAMTHLQQIDNKVGLGTDVVMNKPVAVHYTGWLYDANTPDHKGIKFDSSLDRGEPLTFVVGAQQVIPGWDQGVMGMKVGGQRTLIIPPSLAYGARGAGNVIPPHATLIFDLELVRVDP